MQDHAYKLKCNFYYYHFKANIMQQAKLYPVDFMNNSINMA